MCIDGLAVVSRQADGHRLSRVLSGRVAERHVDASCQPGSSVYKRRQVPGSSAGIRQVAGLCRIRLQRWHLCAGAGSVVNERQASAWTAGQARGVTVRHERPSAERYRDGFRVAAWLAEFSR
jgi:hypothetical protein